MAATPLFEPDGPTGFHYRADFISAADEAALVSEIGNMTFADFEMRGVVAKRRVAFFGESYDRGAAEPIPALLFGLRIALATWAQVEPAAFAMELINE